MDTRIPGWLKLALVIAIVGALNWGLIGLFNWNLVDAIFGGGARETTSTVSRVIYGLVGLAGLASIGLLSERSTARARHMEPAPHSR
ncbi:MAG TPA: DUF378 domain-containing protein [Polyangiaceae bacterium]|nr:DUF378 domain-containing protein [Polyangiaceae bacterium]